MRLNHKNESVELEELYTPIELAKFLKTDIGTVYSLLTNGYFDFIDILDLENFDFEKDNIRIPISSIKKFLYNQSVTHMTEEEIEHEIRNNFK